MPPDRGPAGGRGSRRVTSGGRPPEPPDSAGAARARAIRLLARRDYPRDLLKGRLIASGVEATAAEAAVGALEAERLVNDARYVEAAVARRIAHGHGPIRITLELRRLGLAPELVSGAVDASATEWAERAAAVRRRRFGAATPADPKQRARQVRFLLQRGFTGAHVRHTLATRGHERDPLLDLEAAESWSDADGSGE